MELSDTMARNHKRKKPCEGSKNPMPTKSGGQEVTNSPSWYEKYRLPHFGVNFGQLQQVNVTDLVFPNGIRLDAMCHFRCIVSPPVDSKNMFVQELSAFYSSIRSRNAGASNYSIWEIGRTTLTRRNFDVKWAYINKAVSALETSMSSNANSFHVLWASVGLSQTYQAAAKELADVKSQLHLLAEAIEAIPSLPGMAVFDKDKFLFGTIFLDSKTRKPAMINFMPRVMFDYTVHSTDGVADGLDCTPYYVADTLQGIIDQLWADISKLTDTTTSILRGDLINRFGDRAFKHGYREMIGSGLAVSQEDAEVMSQLENAAILPTTVTGTPFLTTMTCEMRADSTTFSYRMAGVVDSPIPSKANLDEMLLNWHSDSSPTDGEIAAITRLMPLATKTNGTSESRWVIGATDGVTIYDGWYMNSLNDSGTLPTYVKLATILSNSLSTVQSTMRTALVQMGFYGSVIAHSPMLITNVDDPYGFIWDLDRFATVDRDTLDTIHTWVIRSLWHFDSM